MGVGLFANSNYPVREMEDQIISDTGVVEQPRYVGFWARFLAFLLDSIWITIVLAPVLLLLFGEEFMAMVESSANGAASIGVVSGSDASVNLVVKLLLSAPFIIGFWLWKSATPGKMLLSAEIVDAKTLAKPGTGQLIIRYIGYFISLIPFGLGFLWIAFDRRKQGWHDKIAGTLVVKR